MDTLVGFTAGDWLRLLRENQFAIDSSYWRRVAVVTIMSFMNSSDRKKEEKRYGAAINEVDVQPPLFVLGHWRSGTTLLHNVLIQDDQFAYPNLFQATHPHTCLYREAMVTQRLTSSQAEKRHMDNVRITFDSPGEDEPALAVLSLRSPLLAWLFPKREEHYDRYLTFSGVSDEDLARWKTALVTFVKKLTYRYQRPIVLKSPPHTARVRVLLELFPNARFVHIHRNPYTVFQSTRNLYKKTLPNTCLQKPDLEDIDVGILKRYREMYDAFSNDLPLIPAGQFAEVRYEELEHDLVGQIARIYERLNIPGFSSFEPKLKRYADSIADYQKNTYHSLPAELKQQIYSSWQRSFETWGYAA